GKITDKVVDEMNAWQARPLDRVYPDVLIDAIHVKIREGVVSNRPIYVAVGINLAGERDMLGMWVGTGGGGAKGWHGLARSLVRPEERGCRRCPDRGLRWVEGSA